MYPHSMSHYHDLYLQVSAVTFRHISVIQKTVLYHSQMNLGMKIYLIVVIILLLLTPLPFVNKTKYDKLAETVWVGLGYNYFHRHLNLHFYFINSFICMVLTVIYLLASSSFKYSASTRLNNILSFSLSPLYSIKSYMKTNPIGKFSRLTTSYCFEFDRLEFILLFNFDQYLRNGLFNSLSQ
jgi:hypothetical protein